MRVVIWRALVALALLAFVPMAFAEEAPVFDGKALVRAWEFGDEATIERELGRLRGRLADPQQRVKMASHPSVQIDFMAKAEVRLAHGVRAAAGVSGKEGAASVGTRDVKWTGSTNPHDRSVTSTLEHTSFTLPTGIRVKKAYASNVAYKTNLKYANALGRESLVPNSGSVLSIMDRVLGPVRPKTPPPRLLDMASAVGGAVKDAVVPAMFTAGADYDQTTIGESFIIEDPSGNFSFTYTEWERLKRGQRRGEGVKFTTQTISGGVGVKLKKGAGAGVQLSLTVTTDPEAKPDPHKAKILELLRVGRWEEFARLGAEKLAPVLDGERMAKALALLKKLKNHPVTGTTRVLATTNPQVGGVELSYDPAMLETAVPPGHATRVLDRFLTAMEGGQERFVVTSEAGDLTLHAVSLKDLLARADAMTLGPLTRIRGFILDPEGDFVLLGESGLGEPRIELDCLTVALKAVWERGAFPFVSLDPNLTAPGGPQKVRIGGIPADLKNTEFVRIMVEADYAMKRIWLGEDRLALAGFKSGADLLRERQPDHVPPARFWLTPLPSRTADIWIHESVRGTVVLFDSRVQVLTEQMKHAGEYVLGTGAPDPIDEEAADYFTKAYSEIGKRREVFHKLNGVFDLAKLAAIARHRGMQHQLLEKVSARSVRRVEVGDTRTGIGPKLVAGTSFEVWGGALCRVRLDRRFYKDVDLGHLAQRRDDRVSVSFPTSVGLSAREALDANLELQVQRGLEALVMDNPADCERSMTKVLDLDGGFTPARVLRGGSRLLLGRPAAAMEDLDRVMKEAPTPALQAMRGTARVLHGDREDALRDAAAAARSSPRHGGVLAWNAMTYVYAFELAKAEETVDRLLDISPTDAAGWSDWTFLDLLYKMGPARAWERVRLMRAVPFTILTPYSEGLLATQRMDFVTAVRKLGQCLRRIDEAAPRSDLDALHLRERATMALVFALAFQGEIQKQLDGELGARTNEDRELPASTREAAKLVDELEARHPNWPSVHLLRILVGAHDPQRLLEHFEHALEHRDSHDPLLGDISVHLGSDRALAWFGLTLFWKAVTDKEQRRDLSPQIPGLLRRILEVMGDGPDAELLKSLLRSLTAPGQDTLRELRGALLRLPDELPPDPVTIFAVSVTFVIYQGMGAASRDMDDAMEVARRYLRLTDVDELPHSCWTVVSTFRLAAKFSLLHWAEEKLNDYDRWRNLRTDVANGRVEVSEIRAALEAAKQEAWDRIGRDRNALMRLMVVPMFHKPRIEWVLLDLARQAAADIEDPDRRARMERDIERWEEESARPPADLGLDLPKLNRFREELDKAREDLAGVVDPAERARVEQELARTLLKQDPEEFRIVRAALAEAQGPDERARILQDCAGKLLHPERFLEEWLGDVQRPAEIHELSFFGRVFGMSAQVMGPDQPEAARLLKGMERVFRRKVRALSFRRTRRDWASWEAAGPGSEPVGRPMDSRDDSWLAPAVAAAVGLLVIVALVRRWRRRRAA